MADEVTHESASLASSSGGCFELGSVKDTQSQNGPYEQRTWGPETKILSCASNRLREHTLHHSTSRQVQVTLVPGSSLNHVWPFLVKYEGMINRTLTFELVSDLTK